MQPNLSRNWFRSHHLRNTDLVNVEMRALYWMCRIRQIWVRKAEWKGDLGQKEDRDQRRGWGWSWRGHRLSDENLRFPQRKKQRSLRWRKHVRWVIRQMTGDKKEPQMNNRHHHYTVHFTSFPHLLYRNNTLQMSSLYVTISHLMSKKQYLRHGNDHEIQPVPWISKECKIVYTESSRRDFYKRLKRINSCECVPVRQKCWKNEFSVAERDKKKSQ